MQSTETWRPVFGFEGFYEVSDAGRVRSLDRIVAAGRAKRRIHRGRILSPGHDVFGYPIVNLSANGQTNMRKIHRLVLEAFVSPRPHLMEACHGDGNPTNNRLENLRWDTRSENRRDAVRHGTYRNGSEKKTACPRGHDYVAPNLVPAHQRLGHRGCLACARERTWAYDHKLPFSAERADERYRQLMEAASDRSTS